MLVIKFKTLNLLNYNDRTMDSVLYGTIFYNLENTFLE